MKCVTSYPNFEATKKKKRGKRRTYTTEFWFVIPAKGVISLLYFEARFENSGYVEHNLCYGLMKPPTEYNSAGMKYLASCIGERSA